MPCLGITETIQRYFENRGFPKRCDAGLRFPGDTPVTFTLQEGLASIKQSAHGGNAS
jgi:hypothetical protein